MAFDVLFDILVLFMEKDENREPMGPIVRKSLPEAKNNRTLANW